MPVRGPRSPRQCERMSARTARFAPAGRRARVPALVALLVGLASACSGGPLLQAASLSAAQLDASGDGAPVLLRYSVTSPASISVELVGKQGSVYSLRRDEQRPAGSYELTL